MQDGFDCILQYLYEKRKYDFQGNHPEMVLRRMNKRIYKTHTGSVEAYYEYLISNPAEMNELINVLTINVSSFFRNPIVFENIQTLVYNFILEKLQHHDHILRIWSAGCSRGEEPYSIAILLRELRKKISEEKMLMGIFASDIDNQALAQAKIGHYHAKSLHDVKFGFVHTYFTQSGNTYFIADTIRKMVNFSYYDLLDKHSFVPPESAFCDFDVVLCRNVLIYFNPAYQDIIFKKLYRSLHVGGYLVLGEAEVPIKKYKSLFNRVTPCCKIYQKIS